MSQSKLSNELSRGAPGRRAAMVAGARVGAIVAPALSLKLPGAAYADKSERKGYFDGDGLPFHLQHELTHAISCNNVIAKGDQITVGGQKRHAVQQRPGTFFLAFDQALIGKERTFSSNVGWNGKAEGEVIFSVEINGDIIIDGGRSEKNKWAEVERKLPVKARQMRVTQMLDSIRGNNDFS